MKNNFLQISSQGSADKNNLSIAEEVKDPNKFVEWDATPNHAIVQNFESLFSTPKKDVFTPELQTKMFDVDNVVKGQAGIYRTMQDGFTPLGSDIDGKPLYTMSSVSNDQNYDLGKNRLYTTGSIMQQLGAFSDEEEADQFARFTANAGDPKFMGAIAGLSAKGDKKGAVNLIMKEFGYPELDNLDSYDNKEKAYSTAFSAYNYVENVEKLSPAQQSLTLSTLGLMSYKFKDGSTIADKAVVKDADGKTQFNLSEAFNLSSSGFDVFSMQKNWDQLNAIQNITYGKGTPSQLASTGKRMQLLGDPSMGGSAVRQTDAELGRLGFTAVPSAGTGAITGKAANLPSDYEVVGAGEQPDQVIAVPKGLSYSTGTINGTNEIRTLNNTPGLKPASIGAFKTYNNQFPANSTNEVRGTSFAAGLGQSGVLQDPYITSSIATASVYGNVVNPRATKDDIKNLRQQGENTLLNYATAGVSGKIQKADEMLTGGKGEDIRDKIDKLNPVNKVTDAIGAKVLNKGLDFADKNFGGKSKAQQGRDAVRKLGTQSGLINKDNWTVTLSDGTTADVGKDGKSDKRQFRFPDKAVDEVRDLNPYDVDYTNDLDFSSNMMTSSLVRMMAGGKGVPIDQFSGQLANAALGKVGFGQDMTEENFNYVRDNVRSFYFKQGIQTKEDAYAVTNQMFAEGRIVEMDQIAMHQGINMVFDDDGYSGANVLMAGRQKGLEVAAEIPTAPGPNYDIKTTGGGLKMDQLESADMPVSEEVETATLEMNPGTYGGNANTDIFTKSIIKYKDPWGTRNGI